MPILPDQPPAFSFNTAPTRDQARQIVGERVRTARIAAHLTQQELAGTTYSKSYISAVERGKMTPSLQALTNLAERLNVTLAYLLGEEIVLPAPETPEAQAEEEVHAALHEEAEHMVQEGRYEEAIALFKQIEQHDRVGWARERYAEFLATQGRFHEAYEQIRLPLQGKP